VVVFVSIALVATAITCCVLDT